MSKFSKQSNEINFTNIKWNDMKYNFSKYMHKYLWIFLNCFSQILFIFSQYLELYENYLTNSSTLDTNILYIVRDFLKSFCTNIPNMSNENRWCKCCTNISDQFIDMLRSKKCNNLVFTNSTYTKKYLNAIHYESYILMPSSFQIHTCLHIITYEDQWRCIWDQIPWELNLIYPSSMKYSMSRVKMILA